LDGVKIGVCTNIRITHKSIGQTNQQWEDNKLKFEEKYKDKLPVRLTNNKTLEEKINVDKLLLKTRTKIEHYFSKLKKYSKIEHRHERYIKNFTYTVKLMIIYKIYNKLCN
jgi:hypothetical protein